MALMLIIQKYKYVFLNLRKTPEVSHNLQRTKCNGRKLQTGVLLIKCNVR